MGPFLTYVAILVVVTLFCIFAVRILRRIRLSGYARITRRGVGYFGFLFFVMMAVIGSFGHFIISYDLDTMDGSDFPDAIILVFKVALALPFLLPLIIFVREWRYFNPQIKPPE